MNDKDLSPGLLNAYRKLAAHDVKLDSSSSRPQELAARNINLDSSSSGPQELAEDGSIGEFYDRLKYGSSPVWEL